jgi:hypothetical protein
MGTTQEFLRSRYDSIGRIASEHYYAALTIGINNQTCVHVAFPTGADNLMYGGVHVPEHWAKGNLKMSAFASTPGTSSVAVLNFRLRGMYVDNGASTLSDDIIGATTSNITFGASANDLQQATVESTEVNVNKYDMFMWWIGRTGTSGSDTLAADLDIYGVLLEWQPIVATA